MNLFLLILFAILIFLLVEAARMIYLGVVAKKLGKKTKSFSTSKIGKRKIMVMGDSTAVGVGADQPEKSIAGLIAGDFPNTFIENHARKAIGTKELLSDLENLGDFKTDLLIIHIGGMDIVKLRPFKKIKNELDCIVSLVSRGSKRTAISLLYDLSSAPFFRFPFKYIISLRYKKIRKIYTEKLHQEKITFIDLGNDKSPCLFEDKKLFAKDLLHLNNKGYEIWYRKFLEKMSERDWLEKLE